MSPDANLTSGPEPLQFDVAESGGADASGPLTTCKACSRPIASTYYQANGARICEPCRAALDTPRGSRFARGLQATGLGLLAAIAGSLLYFAVAAITGREFGLVAIAVGYMVGRAVRRGSRGRGGWAYQTLAIGLTYLAIVSTYFPLLAKAAARDSVRATNPTPQVDTITISAHTPRAADSATTVAKRETGFPVAQAGTPRSTPIPEKHLAPGTMVVGVAQLLLRAAKVPILAGFSDIMGLLIIGIAVIEAWMLNLRMKITGPHRVAGDGQGAIG